MGGGEIIIEVIEENFYSLGKEFVDQKGLLNFSWSYG